MTSIKLLCVAILCVATFSCVESVTKTISLTPGSTTAWSDSNSWSPVGVPTAGDDVIISYSENYQYAPSLDTANVDVTISSLVISDVVMVGDGRIRVLGSTTIGSSVNLGSVNYDFEGPVTADFFRGTVEAGSVINRAQLTASRFLYSGTTFTNLGSVQLRSSAEFPALDLAQTSTFINAGLLNVSVTYISSFDISVGRFVNSESGVIRHKSITSLTFNTFSETPSAIGGQLWVPEVEFKTGSFYLNCSSCPSLIGSTGVTLILDNDQTPIPQLRTGVCNLRGRNPSIFYAVGRLEVAEQSVIDVFLRVSSLVVSGSFNASKSLTISQNASIVGSIELPEGVSITINETAVLRVSGLVDKSFNTAPGTIVNFGSVVVEDSGEIRSSIINRGTVRLEGNPPSPVSHCDLRNMGDSIPFAGLPGSLSNCRRTALGWNGAVFENRGRIVLGYGWIGIAEIAGRLVFEAGSILSGAENATIRCFECTIELNSDLSVEGAVGFTVNAASIIQGPGRIIGDRFLLVSEWGITLEAGPSFEIPFFTHGGLDEFVSHIDRNITISRFAQLGSTDAVIEPNSELTIGSGATLRVLTRACFEGRIVNNGVFTHFPTPPKPRVDYIGDWLRICPKFVNKGFIQLEHSDLSTGIHIYSSMTEWVSEMTWDDLTLTASSQMALRVVCTETRVDRPCVDNFVLSNVDLAGHLSLSFDRMPQNRDLPSTDYTISVGDSWTIGIWGQNYRISGQFQTVSASGSKLPSNLGVKLQFEQRPEGLRLFAVACDKTADNTCGSIQPNPQVGSVPSSGSNAPVNNGAPRIASSVPIAPDAPVAKNCTGGRLICSSAGLATPPFLLLVVFVFSLLSVFN